MMMAEGPFFSSGGDVMRRKESARKREREKKGARKRQRGEA